MCLLCNHTVTRSAVGNATLKEMDAPLIRLNFGGRAFILVARHYTNSLFYCDSSICAGWILCGYRCHSFKVICCTKLVTVPMILQAMQLPPAFVESSLQHSRYPLNVASKCAYGSALVAYQDRLNKHAKQLFIGPDENSFVIPFKEIDKDTNGRWTITKFNALDGAKLKQQLGDTTKESPNNPTKTAGALATRPDPKCRIMSVSQHNFIEFNR